MSTGTDIQRASDASSAPIGLEDSDGEGLVVPRLRIDKSAVFIDDRTKVEYPELDVVVLGTVKQRVLWHPTMLAGDHVPLCKSWDAVTGNPNTDPTGVDSFPWNAVPDELKPADGKAEGATIECAVCPLVKFGSHPTRDNTPWCTEQDIWVVVFPDSGEASLVTFQRSALGLTRKYKSYFRGAKKPMFTSMTNIKLKAESRGQVEYATPIFSRGAETDDAMHADWAEQYMTIRAFLQTPFVPRDDAVQPPPKADVVAASAPVEAKSTVTAPVAAASSPAASSSTDDDGFDEEPF